LHILYLVCTFSVMAVSNRDGLLEQLRSRRRLPPPAERRRIREAAGVSLRQLAAAIPPGGVSVMAIVRWEAGSTPRDPAHLRAYSELLAELRRFEEVS
jgi:DNA-binding transcriptional regulator YiaG